MTITGMTIDGYKNISFAKLSLDEKMNLVSGKNGAGKSSLIEAIIDAIKGKKEMGKMPQKKIKKGKDKAVIEVTLEDGDDSLLIKRTITQKDVYLKAERTDGKPVSQTDLDRLLDSSTINISKMLGLGPKDQIDFVKRVAGIDTSKVEAEYKEKYAIRTGLNRTLKDATTLEGESECEKTEPVSVSDLLTEIEEANSVNRQIDEHEKTMEADDAKIRTMELRDEELAQEIAKYEDIIDNLNHQRTSLADSISEATTIAKVNAKKEMPERVDTAPLLKKVADAEEENKKANAYEQYVNATAAVKKAQAAVDKINGEMAALLKERESIIANGKLPFKNIDLNKELGLTVGGIPLNEMSSAEQIKIMSRVYIESKPELHVIYIKDGSLLDPDTLKELSEMSDLKDYQFLVEVVGEQEGSIVMREGNVISGAEEEDDREEL